MKRRALLALALASLAATVLAVAPWTVSSGRLVEEVAGQLRTHYGLQLEAAGNTTIAILPVPRVKLEGVSIGEPGQAPVVRGGILRGEMRWWPLLTGRIELAEVSLAGSRIDIATDPDGLAPWRRLGAVLLRQARDPQARSGVRRLTLLGSTILIQTPDVEARSVIRDVTLVANWAGGGDTLEVGGSFIWRDERVQIALTDLVPASLAAGRTSPVALRLAGGIGRLTVTATADGGTGPLLSGRSAFETRSLRDLLRWSGRHLPLGDAVDAMTLDGDFTYQGGTLAWPAVRLMLGPDRLDGALSARTEDGRLAVTGTLASDKLTLTRFGTPILHAVSPGGTWNREPADLAALTRSDLDLRLSIAAGRLGGVRFEDLALSLLIKPNRIEASLGRATVDGGRLKGRLAIAGGHPGGLDLRAQASIDGLEIATLLTELGQGRWITGLAQGQAAIEATGTSVAEMAARTTGRAVLAVRGGEFVGVAFADALRRFERTPIAASLDWRGGRTPFDHASVTLAVTHGTGLITEGGFTSPALRGRLQGRISLPERRLTTRTLVEMASSPAGNLSPALAFEIAGPWNRLAITPDARTLIQRSNAVHSLLPPEPVRLAPDPVQDMLAR